MPHAVSEPGEPLEFLETTVQTTEKDSLKHEILKAPFYHMIFENHLNLSPYLKNKHFIDFSHRAEGIIPRK